MGTMYFRGAPVGPVNIVQSGYIPVYGVTGENAANPMLSRSGDAIGLGFTLNENGSITSDFDRCRPWSDIQQVNDAAGNVFMRIPKHYVKYTVESDGTLSTQICMVKKDTSWLLNPIFINQATGAELDYVDVGKYDASGTSSLAKSVRGASPLVNITRAGMRNACRANGTGYQQMDIWCYKMLQDLFKVEFATTNSQAIMYGYANDNSVAIESGTTDTVITASGSYVSNTDGKHAMKYRGIENMWGNVWQYCDGVNVNDYQPYFCENPNNYADDTAANYYAVNYKCPSSNGWPGKFGFDSEHPFAQYPDANGGTGSDSSYHCDYFWIGSGWRILIVGGRWSTGSNAGAWSFDSSYGSGLASATVGGRLLRRPL